MKSKRVNNLIRRVEAFVLHWAYTKTGKSRKYETFGNALFVCFKHDDLKIQMQR